MIAAPLLGGCVQEVEFDVPRGPDMSAVVEAFATPTADFTNDVAASFAVNAFTALGISGDLGAHCEPEQPCAGPQILVEALGGLLNPGGDDSRGDDPAAPVGEAELRRFELNVGGVEVDAEGFAEITTICPGLAEAAGRTFADIQNGSIKLTSTFTAAGIDPVIWGTAAQCILGVDGVAQTLDAALNLWVGDNFDLDGDLEALGQSPIIFDIHGTRAIGDAGASALDLAFKAGGGVFELLVPQGDEHLILAKRGEEIAFRAANGVFRCATLGQGFASGACEDVAGDFGEVQW